MEKKTILFDLDGTLLPMDQEKFVHHYFGLLAKKLAPFGYDPKTLGRNIWAGVAAMVRNDGSCVNEVAFWNEFARIYGEHVRAHAPVFEEFYGVEFQEARISCGFNPQAGETVRELKRLGYQVALATNPIFPGIATENRIRWAGLEPGEFSFFTTYENSTYSKPNPKYFEEVLKKAGCRAEECLMVGNDVIEDGAAKELGIDVFFLTDCLINKEGKDISQEPHGDFAALLTYIEEK